MTLLYRSQWLHRCYTLRVFFLVIVQTHTQLPAAVAVATWSPFCPRCCFIINDTLTFCWPQQPSHQRWRGWSPRGLRTAAPLWRRTASQQVRTRTVEHLGKDPGYETSKLNKLELKDVDLSSRSQNCNGRMEELETRSSGQDHEGTISSSADVSALGSQRPSLGLRGSADPS